MEERRRGIVGRALELYANGAKAIEAHGGRQNIPCSWRVQNGSCSRRFGEVYDENGGGLSGLRMAVNELTGRCPYMQTLHTRAELAARLGKLTLIAGATALNPIGGGGGDVIVGCFDLNEKCQRG